MPIYRLSEEIVFPPAELATKEGLLALGGDLTPQRLLTAYCMGIFPWYSENEPILWWSPDPRLVLYPHEIHVSRRLQRTLRQQKFHLTMDQAFEQVIRACSDVNIHKDKGTWITSEMIRAYCRLHRMGFGHSIEAWQDGVLAGGLYGVSLGRCFFGESMFSQVRDASKVVMVTLSRYLQKKHFTMLDCQVSSDHLVRMGAREIPRTDFLQQLDQALQHPTHQGLWSL